MKKSLFIAFIFFTIQSFAQVGINTNSPHPSSILDVTSSNKGLLFPRMTQSQRNNIVSPAAGLVVWCTNCGSNGELQVYNGVDWTTALGAVTSAPPAIAPSNLSYAGSPFSYYLQIPITPADPTNQGGSVTNYTITPALPNGLIFNASTGQITGTPTILSAAANYTVTAANAFGNITTVISIEVNNPAPPSSLAYSGSPFSFNYLSPISPIHYPIYTGGAIESYSISPSLPSGIILNSTTGTLSGNPTVLSPASNYIITASNSSGNTTTSISITVNNIPPTNLQYTGSPFTFFQNNSITPITSPTNSGGIVTSYSIAPALPSGLVLNTSTGEISGTSTVAIAATDYTITASNVTGSTTATINIKVSPVLDLTGINNTTTTVAYSLRKLSSSYTGSAIRVRRSSDDAEQNIGFDGSGNLDQVALTTFVGSSNGFVTVWYDQSGKGKNVTQTTNSNQPKIVSNGNVITRNGKPVMKFELGANSYLRNTSVTNSLPVSMVNVAGVDGVSSSEFNISSIGGSNGICMRIINGQLIIIKIGNAIVNTSSYTAAGQLNILSVVQTSTTGEMFLNGTQSTITSGGSNGVSNPSSNITIGAPGDIGAYSNDGFISESIFYSSLLSTLDRQSLEVNQATYYGLFPAFTYPSTTVGHYGNSITISPSSIVNTETLIITPSLPSGLTMNSTTGVISGTPTVISGQTTYTVTSTTGLGYGTSSFNFSVIDVAPSFNYANTNLTLNDPASILPNILSGMLSATFSISPSLPSGLTLNTNTGEISGTPTTAISLTTFTITATNSGGTSSANLNLYVGSPASPVNFVYNGSPYVFLVGSSISPLDTPTNQGGVPTSYLISPSLPTGLLFNTSTGVITGTPSALLSVTNYSITASNSSGNTTTSISITINNAPPTNLQYTGSPFTFFQNNSITPITSPTNSGGIVTSYSIAPALPSGLVLNTSTGEISGTSTVAIAATDYTITASNVTGSTTATINIKVSPVLDLTGINNTTTTVAYSLRKLSSSYTGSAIRVRRSSDDAEQNIGFDGSGNLDQVALTTFVGSSNGFVTVWYDQSGKGKNVTQTTNSNQPKIVSNGNVITRNGKPVMKFELGANSYLRNTSVTNSLPVSMVNVAGVDGVSSSEFNISSIGGSDGICMRILNGQLIIIKIGVVLANTSSYLSAGQLNILSVSQTSTTGEIFLNGTQSTITSGAANGVINPSSNITIGRPGDFGSNSTDGFISESIFYSSFLSTGDRQSINANQAAYYVVTIN